MTYRPHEQSARLPAKDKHHPMRVVFSSDLPSRTRVEAQHETDINLIVSRFAATGLPLHQIAAMAGVPQYGDLVGSPDLATVLQRQLDGQRAWMSLPEDVRRSVGDPSNLVPWLNDPVNQASALKHGLLKPAPQGASSQTAPPPVPPTPPTGAPNSSSSSSTTSLPKT